MRLSEQQVARYTQALRGHGDDPVVVESDVTTIVMIVGALQLALRHPRFPSTMRMVIDGILTCWSEKLASVDPLFAEVIALGDDPKLDVWWN